jgi:DNA-binding HxlR family transcriptional regulator
VGAERRGGERPIADRAVANALALLAAPVNAATLSALAGAPRTLAELRHEAGSRPQTTMRSYLQSLSEIDVVERQGSNGASASYRLTPAGADLLSVSHGLGAWLSRAPGGALTLGGNEAKSAVRTLVDGWSSGMVRALAARPMALTELDSVIAAVSYPTLERRLAAMRLLGMVQPVPSSGRSTPYAVTDWLRAAVAPLAAATYWQHRHLPERLPPIKKRDVEAGFLLAAPLLRLDEGSSGTCRLAVRMGRPGSGSAGLVGIVAEVRMGVVVSCVTSVGDRADAWADGAAKAWVAAMADRDLSHLECGGKAGLARRLVAEMPRRLSSA